MADFESVFSEHYDSIYKYLLKLCRDSSLAEELTQECFFRAYVNYGQLRDPAKLPVWLCQIAKNSYYAWYREQKRRSDLQEDVASDVPDLAELFSEKSLSENAYARLHELEEPYKEVFLLSVFAGLSFREISALFSKSESWARVTFYRARKKLMERMR